MLLRNKNVMASRPEFVDISKDTRNDKLKSEFKMRGRKRDIIDIDDIIASEDRPGI